MARIPITATLLTASQLAGGGNNYTTASVSPTAGKLVLVFTSNENSSAGTSASATSVVGAGLNFTKVAEVIQDNTWSMSSIWCACSNSPSTGTIAINHAVNKSTCSWVVMEFDADASAADNGLSAIIQSLAQGPGAGPGTVITANLNDFENSANAVAVFGQQTNGNTGLFPLTSTPSSGVTEISDQSLNTGSGWLIHTSSYFKDSADKNAGYTNSTGTAFNVVSAIAVELKSRASADPQGNPMAITPVNDAATYLDVAGLLRVGYLTVTTSSSDYPVGATPITAASGNVAAAVATATLAGAASLTTYITGFEITGSGATAASVVSVTVTGTVSGTLTYTLAVAAGVSVANQPLIIQFSPAIPASAVNTSIVVSCPSLGTGNTNNTVVAHGYRK